MSKKLEDPRHEAEAQAFEIIELAIDDVNLLTEAFDVINQVCKELNDPAINLEPAPAKLVLH
jgi:hypothetical protein